MDRTDFTGTNLSGTNLSGVVAGSSFANAEIEGLISPAPCSIVMTRSSCATSQRVDAPKLDCPEFQPRNLPGLQSPAGS